MRDIAEVVSLLRGMLSKYLPKVYKATIIKELNQQLLKGLILQSY